MPIRFFFVCSEHTTVIFCSMCIEKCDVPTNVLEWVSNVATEDAQKDQIW